MQWKGFPLHPEIPEEGIPLAKIYAARGIDLNQAKLRLKKVAEELGLPLADRNMSYNSRLAQELAKWAEEKGKGDAFHEAVFRAYFVERKNIALVDELTRLTEAIGLPAEEAKAVLQQRKYNQAVDEDWSEAMNSGISAVPTFVVKGRMAVGAQPYEDLAQFVETCGVKRRQNPRA